MSGESEKDVVESGFVKGYVLDLDGGGGEAAHRIGQRLSVILGGQADTPPDRIEADVTVPLLSERPQRP